MSRKHDVGVWLCAVLALAVWFGVPLKVQGHNRAVHQKSTETAFLIMKMASLQKYTKDHIMFIRPDSVPEAEQAEWDEFVARLAASSKWYGTLQSHLLPPASFVCGWAIEGGATNTMSAAQSTAMTGPMNLVPFSVSTDYHTSGSACGIPAEPYKPGGAVANPFDDVSSDRTGNILGFWTADVDMHDMDSRMWMRPTNVPGIQQLKEAADEGYKAGAESILVPIACAWKCFWSIFGLSDCKKCVDAVEDFVDSNDPVKALDSLVPGGDVNDSMFTGLWHHIKAHGPHSDTYDVRQG